VERDIRRINYEMTKLKELNKIAEKWTAKNGASRIDFKNREIIIWDGGLFGGEVKKRKIPRTKFRLDPIPNSKNKLCVWTKTGGMKNDYYFEGSLWFEDISSIIRYFNRLKKLLNKHGFPTDIKASRTR